jgi:hypothetical protein
MSIRRHRTSRLLAFLVGLALPATALAGSGSQASQVNGSSRGGHASHGSHGSHGSQKSHGARGHHGSRGGHHGGHWSHGSHRWYGYGGFGFYGGYPGYGYYGYPGAYGGGWGYTSVYPSPGATHGALDLDVSPERAQIYVDGELVGTADDFDGFPDFLWLEKGTYDVVIFNPGFQTIARQYSIYGGLVIDVEDTMVPGQETQPQDLISKSTVNRDERLRRDRENEEELRAPGERRRREVRETTAAPDRLDARGEPGRLVLRVLPDDASVYLDGRFLGTGREMARLRSGLIVDPGDHHLEVVRPGRQSRDESFTVEAGEEVSVDIELDEE